MSPGVKLTILTAAVVLGSVFVPVLVWGDVESVTQGRPADPRLKMKSSQVPTFDLIQTKVVNGKKEQFRVRNVPKLDLGEERRLKASQLQPVKFPSSKKYTPLKIQERPSPPEIFIDHVVSKTKTLPAPEAKVLRPLDPSFKAPLVKQPVPVSVVTMDEPTLKEHELSDIGPSQMKLLQALIFLEIQKEYGLALGLFAELINDPSPEIRVESKYHLALTTLNVGLYSEYKHHMEAVLKNGTEEWQKKAALSLATNAEPGDKELVARLEPLFNQWGIEADRSEQYQLNRAKYYLDKEDLGMAMGAADNIPLTSPKYIQALFLKGLLLYKSADIQGAIGLQRQVLAHYTEKEKDSDMRSIVALTLARLHFQAGQYKEAFDTYLFVDKKHPDWLQAMIEQAWTQIISSDYEGAAGNMFSLHTDFFKKAFHPESYIVRTVSYLNLCQFGDGAKSVYDLKRRYDPVKEQMVNFSSQAKDEEYFYDTVKFWAKNPAQPVVNGLPRELIFQLTRHPAFIDRQENINSLEDQVVKFNRLAVDIIKKEREALAKQNDARARIADFKKSFEKADENSREQIKERSQFQARRLLNYQIQHHIAKKARLAIRDLRKTGLERMNSEQKVARIAAGSALKQRFESMKSRLVASLDQVDLLQYELYSGAGEHIRYQMAGGKIDEKQRDQLKVADGKALKWEFKGEIWEDELGHYRSSLQNVCAPEDNITQAQ